MSQRDKRKEILSRIESGTINAAEGIRALMALEGEGESEAGQGNEAASHDDGANAESPAGPRSAKVVMKAKLGHAADEDLERMVEVGDAAIDAALEMDDEPQGGPGTSESESRPRRKAIKVVVKRDAHPEDVAESGDESVVEGKGGRVRINLAGFLGKKGGRSLRVRVGQENGDEDRVRIDLPVSIAEAGLRLMERIDPEGSWDDHLASLREEGAHTLLEVVESDGEHIRISVE
jgi:hypothetical protein